MPLRGMIAQNDREEVIFLSKTSTTAAINPCIIKFNGLPQLNTKRQPSNHPLSTLNQCEPDIMQEQSSTSSLPTQDIELGYVPSERHEDGDMAVPKAGDVPYTANDGGLVASVPSSNPVEINHQPETMELSEEEAIHRRRAFCKKSIFAILLIAIIVFIVADSLTTGYVRSAISAFLEWIEANPGAGILAFILVYFAATVLFIPGSILTVSICKERENGERVVCVVVFGYGGVDVCRFLPTPRSSPLPSSSVLVACSWELALFSPVLLVLDSEFVSVHLLFLSVHRPGPLCRSYLAGTSFETRSET
jgi:hypothetical protein